MAKNFKKGLSLALAAMMCAGTMNVTALAATCDGWYGGNVSLDVVKGEEPYTYALFSDPNEDYFYYETSNHTLKKEVTGGGAVHLITLIDTANHLDKNGNWTPDGLYVCGESNYDVVYCCDAVTETDAEAGNYKRLNLEDSEYFSDKDARRLRAIAEHSYPFVSVDEAKAWLVEKGFNQEMAAKLDRSELITATQGAIWSIANAGNGDSYEYNKTASTPQKYTWGHSLHEFTEDDGEFMSFTDYTSRKYTTPADVNERITALKAFLLALTPAEAEEGQIVITDMRFSEPMKAKSEDLYTFELTVELNQAVDSDDKIVISTYVNGKHYDTVGFGEGTEDTVTVEAKADAEVKVVVSGTQNLEKGVYFYAPEGGRELSQNLIGVGMGDTPVYAEAEMSFEKVTFKGGTVSNISYMFINEETGAVDFIKKIDVAENATSAPIMTMEGYVSVMFMKQGTSGMFWFSEKVDKADEKAAIECLIDNNPSYKGHNAIAYGEGSHDLEFKKNKVVTYSFIDEYVYIGNTTAGNDDATAGNDDVTEGNDDAAEGNDDAAEGNDDATAEPAEPTLDVDVDGADVTDWTTTVNGVTAIYIKGEGKVPDVIWTSDEVDADTMAALIAEFGADEDAKTVFGFDSHEIEYNHNKNKIKTVTYTFE